MQNHWLVWRGAFVWALIIGILQTLHAINQIPLLWFSYDTAVSLQKFIALLVVRILIQFLLYTSVSAFIIMIAESLTRKAFPERLQFWKLWSSHTGSSLQVLGQTIGGYLILGFDFAYSIGLYYFAVKYLGWWSPSEALYNPNTLATYVPWISPIASSLSAGFLEECLFRAIPLAGAALLGKRFGKQPLWIAAAFVLQAVVFGAAHANYPAQPAYARLVELLIPSGVFGCIYLFYGLMPAILSHFIFDVVWFSLPIFVSHASGIWFDKMLIIAICLIPLVVVLYRRLKLGKWIAVVSGDYNLDWKPLKNDFPEEKSSVHEEQKTIHFSSMYSKLFTVFGLLGVISWTLFTRFTHDALPLGDSRAKAIEFAQNRTMVKDAQWSSLAGVEIPLHTDDAQHIYIWRTLGALSYKKLLNKYLVPPVWKIRQVKFEGDIADRAEEYTVLFNEKTNNEATLRIHHQLPESREVPSLSLEQARAHALTTAQSMYGLSADQLTEISAVSTKQPNRVDWVFTFSDTTQKIAQGQARITIEVDGDNVVDYYRSVFVPEEWGRAYKDEESFINLIGTISGLLQYLLLIFAAMIIIAFGRRDIQFSLKMFFVIMSFLFLKSCIQAGNIWPLATFTFNTTEPFNHQAWRVVNLWLIFALFKSVLFGILAGFLQVCRFKSPQINNKFSLYIWLGVVFGLIQAGLISLLKWLVPLHNPLWPDFDAAGAYWPFLSEGLTAWTNFIEGTLIVLLIFTAADYVSNGWKKFKWLALLYIIFINLLSVDIHEISQLWIWLLVGLCLGLLVSILYVYGIRFARASIPITVALFGSLKIVQQMIFNAYPQVFIGGLLAIILMVAFAVYWSYQLAYNNNGFRLINRKN